MIDRKLIVRKPPTKKNHLPKKKKKKTTHQKQPTKRGKRKSHPPGSLWDNVLLQLQRRQRAPALKHRLQHVCFSFIVSITDAASRCVRMERNFCGIEYTACTDTINPSPQSFSVSGSSNTGSQVHSGHSWYPPFLHLCDINVILNEHIYVNDRLPPGWNRLFHGLVDNPLRDKHQRPLCSKWNSRCLRRQVPSFFNDHPRF